MKNAFIICFLILVCPMLVTSQVLDLTNVKREVTAKSYDSTYCFIPSNLEQEDHAGFVGEEIMILDLPAQYTDYFSKQLVGKTFHIAEYIPGDQAYEDEFKLTHESKDHVVPIKGLNSDNAYLIGGLVIMKELLIGQADIVISRFDSEKYIQGFDGKRHRANKIYKVEDVKIGKIKEDEFSPVAVFENGLILRIDESSRGRLTFVDHDNNSFYFYEGRGIEDVEAGLGDAGAGLGEYDDSGDGVYGRRVIHRNLKGLFSSKVVSGKTVIKICVNRQGIVGYAEILETTIKDRKQLKKILSAAKGYKYEPDPTAPIEQCGKLTIDFDMGFNKKTTEGSSKIGGGLTNRGIIYEPVIQENSNQTGTVSIEICVNASGEVISAKFSQRGSTTTNKSLVNTAISGAKKYRFTASEIEKQCGTVTVNFT